MSLMTLAVAAVASGAATGLGGGGGDSGVRGRVVPCGIVLERAAPCATGAEPISIVVEQGDRVVHREKVREGGSFRVRLEAGRYWLRPQSGAATGARVRATVTDGEWTTVTLVAGSVSPPLDRR